MGLRMDLELQAQLESLARGEQAEPGSVTELAGESLLRMVENTGKAILQLRMDLARIERRLDRLEAAKNHAEPGSLL